MKTEEEEEKQEAAAAMLEENPSLQELSACLQQGRTEAFSDNAASSKVFPHRSTP